MDSAPVKASIRSSGDFPCNDVKNLSENGLLFRDVITLATGCQDTPNSIDEQIGKRDSSTDHGKTVQIKGLQRNGSIKKSGEKKISVDEFVAVFCRELLDEVTTTEEQRKIVKERELDAYLENLVTRTLECLLEEETEKQSQDQTKSGEIFQDEMDAFIDNLLQRVTEAVLKQHTPNNSRALNGKQQQQVIVKVPKSACRWTGKSLGVFQGNFETTITWEWMDGLEKSKDTREVIAKTDSEGRVWVGHKVEKSLMLQEQVTGVEKPIKELSKVSTACKPLSGVIKLSLDESTREKLNVISRVEETSSTLKNLKASLTSDLGNGDKKTAQFDAIPQENLIETISKSGSHVMIQSSKDKENPDDPEATSSYVPIGTSEEAPKNAGRSLLAENIWTQKLVEQDQFLNGKGLRKYPIMQREDWNNNDSGKSRGCPAFKTDDRQKKAIETPSRSRPARVPKIVKPVSSAHRRNSGTQLTNSKTSLSESIAPPGQESATNLTPSEHQGSTEKKDEQATQTENSEIADDKAKVTPSSDPDSKETDPKIKRSISNRVKELLRKFRRQGLSEDGDSGKDTAI